jgi:hypothetical protein
MKVGLVILLLAWFGEATVHPLHVSVMEIAHDTKEKELEITLRIFTDDLETAIRNKLNQPELAILKPAGSTVDKLTWAYLQPQLNIMLDGKKQTLKYLGHEKDEDAIIFYIQVQPVKTWRTIEIRNSVLTELYEDQSNLVNVAFGEETKSLRLMRDNPSGRLSFDLK